MQVVGFPRLGCCRLTTTLAGLGLDWMQDAGPAARGGPPLKGNMAQRHGPGKKKKDRSSDWSILLLRFGLGIPIQLLREADQCEECVLVAEESDESIFFLVPPPITKT